MISIAKGFGSISMIREVQWFFQIQFDFMIFIKICFRKLVRGELSNFLFKLSFFMKRGWI